MVLRPACGRRVVRPNGPLLGSMRMLKHPPYFRRHPGEPTPLSHTVERTCRFEEVDPLGIMWHGRYASYLEDARVALGDRYGIGYMTCRENGVAVPIKHMHLDYVTPLRFAMPCWITASLHWDEAARLNMSYSIRDENDAVLTQGWTVQLFVTFEGTLLMARPDFFENFCREWRAGRIG